jgi:SAM-dependent methyltransferase
MTDKRIKDAVKARYSQIAKDNRQSCCSNCGCDVNSLTRAESVGYSRDDLERIPEESVMGLGCGNPTAIAELELGEIVLDLGSGAGIDVFLAANKVGPKGKVIGIDMTKEMVDKASAIARNNGYENIEFRLGEIENLPLSDDSVDTIISNCVINLCPDKSRVFREARRVLRAGGKLVISDIVAERVLSDEMRHDLNAWAGCVAGTLQQEEYLSKIREAGFNDLELISNREFYVEDSKTKEMVKLLSITVKGHKSVP